MIELAAGVDVLNAKLPANELIDFLRYIVGFLGLTHLLFATSRLLTHQVFWTGIAFMSTGLLTMLQQTEAVGDPLVPWRLPLYAIMNIAGIIYLYKLGPAGHEAQSHQDQR